MAKFDRGRSDCSTSKCSGDVAVSVLLVATSPGGRKERKQVNSGTFRLCTACAKGLGNGKMSAELRKGISNAMWQLGMEDSK